MLITLEGSSALPDSLSLGSNCCVKKKTPFTLVSMTLSHPFSEYSSIGSPHEAPALLTKISKASSAGNISLSAFIPSKFDKSPGTEIHSPPYSS